MTDVAKISRVRVGVDFDEASAAALKMAGSLAAAWDAELTAYHAATAAVPAYFTTSQIGQTEEERAQSRAAVADQLRIFAQRQISGAVNVLGRGRTAAGRDRAHRSFVRSDSRRNPPPAWSTAMGLGSVSEALVRQSRRPVLVVPAGASLPDTHRVPTILDAGGDGATADAWVDVLRPAIGGQRRSFVGYSPVHAGRLQHADLIVLSMPADDSHSQLSAVAHVLKECVHPVLFVPSSQGHFERSSS